MAAYYSSDIDFINLVNLTLRALHEPVGTGSEAVPLDLVKDTLNTVYAEAFNDQRMKQSARENDVSFTLANDTTLAADASPGAVTLTLTDSSTWRTLGKALLQSEIVSYANNDLSTTLSGVTGVSTLQLSGTAIRQLYQLSDLASDIQEEQIQYLDVNGLPQQYMSYENSITAINFNPNTYSIYKGHLLFSRQASLGTGTNAAKVLMIYTQKVTPLSSDTDKPSLIPNSWRVPILVYGACMKIGAEDAFRTSWDWWKAEYEKALSQYIAFKNNRVKDVQNKRRPSVYNSYSMFR